MSKNWVVVFITILTMVVGSIATAGGPCYRYFKHHRARRAEPPWLVLNRTTGEMRLYRACAVESLRCRFWFAAVCWAAIPLVHAGRLHVVRSPDMPRPRSAHRCSTLRPRRVVHQFSTLRRLVRRQFPNVGPNTVPNMVPNMVRVRPVMVTLRPAAVPLVSRALTCWLVSSAGRDHCDCGG